MANLAFKRIGTILILVHNDKPPLEEEWARYLALLTSIDLEIKGDPSQASAVVFTDGGAPTSSQRLSLKKQLQGRDGRSAVITENIMVRGIIGIVGLFNKAIASFGPGDWKQAMNYAKVPERQHLEILQGAISLSREVGGSHVLRSIGL